MFIIIWKQIIYYLTTSFIVKTVLEGMMQFDFLSSIGCLKAHKFGSGTVANWRLASYAENLNTNFEFLTMKNTLYVRIRYLGGLAITSSKTFLQLNFLNVGMSR